MPNKKNNTSDKDNADNGAGDMSWQAQKSAMTRDRILDAAINCFIDLGYTNVTTAKVAGAAGVSRGAMLHHFPSKTELIQAAVEYLHNKLLEDYTHRVGSIPASLKGTSRRRAGLGAYWEYLNSDLFIVYQELCTASRTDPELKAILENSQQIFDTHVDESNMQLFEEWKDRGDRYRLAMDVSRFMMEGMAKSQLMNNRTQRVERMISYLADRLEEIFQEGEGSAIDRHTAD